MRMDKEGLKKLNFKKGDGLLPAIIQDIESRNVLMLGYMNQESLSKTLEIGKVTFYSRSKGRLWTKGETSSNFLIVKDIKVDCDNDTLLILAKREGPVCHQGTITCFGDDYSGLSFLSKLEQVILDRKENPDKHSYTSSLFQAGIDKVAQKVGEEAVELVIEAKNEDPVHFHDEAADLLYHYLVLLRAKESSLSKVLQVLVERHG